MRLRAQPSPFRFVPPLVLAVSALCGLLNERPPDAVLLAAMLGWSAVLFWTLARALDENKALVFFVLSLLIAFCFEAFAINRSRLLTHYTHPQIWNVPLPILFGWFVAVSASYAFVAALIGRRNITLTAAATGVVAMLLDFLLDPMGLGTGWWVWLRAGSYAPWLRGVNGVSGIPWSNFVGWFVLSVLVVTSFELLTRKGARDRQIFVRDTFDLRWSSLLYFALCMPGLFWLLRTGNWSLFLLPAVPLGALAFITRQKLKHPRRFR
jgi:uncharacterized membrane protein